MFGVPFARDRLWPARGVARMHMSSGKVALNRERLNLLDAMMQSRSNFSPSKTMPLPHPSAVPKT